MTKLRRCTRKLLIASGQLDAKKHLELAAALRGRRLSSLPRLAHVIDDLRRKSHYP